MHPNDYYLALLKLTSSQELRSACFCEIALDCAKPDTALTLVPTSMIGPLLIKATNHIN